MTARRVVVGAALATGVAVLAASAGPWVRAGTSSAVAADVAIAVSGSDAAPGAGAGGLVVLAAALALALGGRRGRWMAAAGIALGGGLVVSAALGVVRDAQRIALSAAQSTVGVAVVDGSAHPTVLPWLTLVLGVVCVGVAVLTVVAGRAWSPPSARHEQPAAYGGQTDWDALSRGEDPS